MWVLASLPQWVASNSQSRRAEACGQANTWQWPWHAVHHPDGLTQGKTLERADWTEEGLNTGWMTLSSLSLWCLTVFPVHFPQALCECLRLPKSIPVCQEFSSVLVLILFVSFVIKTVFCFLCKLKPSKNDRALSCISPSFFLSIRINK